jgi:hypothetical protein
LSTHHQKYLFEAGFYDQILEDASVSDITALAKKFLNLYFYDKHYADDLQLPVPEIKIRNNVNSKTLGRCLWRKGAKNTTIELQKSIVDNEKTLNRVLIHELIHHYVFLTNPENDGSDGHGGAWRKKADELNKTLGADYISQTSDESYEKNGKEYYIVIVPKAGSSRYSFISTVSPSMSQKATILELLKINGRIFKINDEYFAGVTKLSSTGDDKANARLKEIYDTGKEVKIPGLDKGNPSDLNIKVDILGDGGKVLGTVSADYVRKKIRARSGTVSDWIEKYNEKFVTKARIAQ